LLDRLALGDMVTVTRIDATIAQISPPAVAG
jgi:hypothetical protein